MVVGWLLGCWLVGWLVGWLVVDWLVGCWLAVQDFLNEELLWWRTFLTDPVGWLIGCWLVGWLVVPLLPRTLKMSNFWGGDFFDEAWCLVAWLVGCLPGVGPGLLQRSTSLSGCPACLPAPGLPGIF